MCCAVYVQLPCVVVALYQAWAIKLDLDYMFLCPTCGDSPDVLIGDATSESILGRYYNGTPIKEVDPVDDAEYHRPHTKAQHALFRAPSACCSALPHMSGLTIVQPLVVGLMLQLSHMSMIIQTQHLC